MNKLIIIKYCLLAIIGVILPFKSYTQIKYPTLFQNGIRAEKFPPGFDFVTSKLLKKIYVTSSSGNSITYSNAVGYSCTMVADETIVIPLAQKGLRLIIYPHPNKELKFYRHPPNKEEMLNIGMTIDYRMIGKWDEEFGKSDSPDDVPKNVRKHFIPLVFYFKLYEDNSVEIVEALLRSIDIKNDKEKISYIVTKINNYYKYSNLQIDTNAINGDLYSFTNLNLIKTQINKNAFFSEKDLEYGGVIYEVFVRKGKEGKKIVSEITQMINRDWGIEGNSYEILRSLLVPSITGSALIHHAAIEIPRNILTPLDTNYSVEKSIKARTLLNFDTLGMVYCYNDYRDSKLYSKILLHFRQEENCRLSNLMSQIGKTGFMLSFTKAYLHTLYDQSFLLEYEPICANESTILFMKSVTVGLPIKYFGKNEEGEVFTLQGSRFSIGKEGVCGFVNIEENETKRVKFEGNDLELTKCSILFENNEIKTANMEGVLRLPNENVSITIHVSKNGNITYTNNPIFIR